MKSVFVVRAVALALGVALLGQGCLGAKEVGPDGPDGGVFKTEDRGLTWTKKRVLVEGPRGVAMDDEVIVDLVADPQDHLAVYAATARRGLLVSIDGGDSWRPHGILATGRVEAVAVDPKNKCVVYATQGNKIFKTDNCGRDWRQIWFDPKVDKVFTRLAIDWFNSTAVYAGTSEGDILKSTDAGANWLVAKRAGSPVTAIAIHPTDSRVVYVATRGDGLWRTLDGGNTWLQIERQWSDFTNARRMSHVVVDPLNPTVVYAVSQFGILVSRDGAETWEALPLVSPPGSVEIRDFAVNPRESAEIQYVTTNTLVHSSDGGKTWTTQRLPSARVASSLLIDAEKGDVLYVGMGPAPEK
jgi:photosystem II stability/assembly factor-like uncharacterized protein